MELYNIIEKDIKNTYIKDAVNNLIEIIKEYGTDRLSLCFNGGKDCTVVLYLLIAALAKLYNDSISEDEAKKYTLENIPIVYFRLYDEFDQVLEFHQDIQKYLNFTILIYTEKSMKLSLEKLLQDYPKRDIMLCGSRKNDPGGKNLELITPCDIDWPPIIRVNIIINWKYHQVWKFLYLYNLPYCCIYNLGYTSLGSKIKTFPNSILRKKWSMKLFCNKYPCDIDNEPLYSIFFNNSTQIDSINFYLQQYLIVFNKKTYISSINNKELIDDWNDEREKVFNKLKELHNYLIKENDIYNIFKKVYNDIEKYKSEDLLSIEEIMELYYERLEISKEFAFTNLILNYSPNKEQIDSIISDITKKYLSVNILESNISIYDTIISTLYWPFFNSQYLRNDDQERQNRT